MASGFTTAQTDRMKVGELARLPAAMSRSNTAGQSTEMRPQSAGCLVSGCVATLVVWKSFPLRQRL